MLCESQKSYSFLSVSVQASYNFRLRCTAEFRLSLSSRVQDFFVWQLYASSKKHHQRASIRRHRAATSSSPKPSKIMATTNVQGPPKGAPAGAPSEQSTTTSVELFVRVCEKKEVQDWYYPDDERSAEWNEEHEKIEKQIKKQFERLGCEITQYKRELNHAGNEFATVSFEKEEDQEFFLMACKREHFRSKLSPNPDYTSICVFGKHHHITEAVRTLRVAKEKAMSAVWFLQEETTLHNQPSDAVIVEEERGDAEYRQRVLRAAIDHARKKVDEAVENNGKDFIPQPVADHLAKEIKVAQATYQQNRLLIIDLEKVVAPAEVEEKAEGGAAPGATEESDEVGPGRATAAAVESPQQLAPGKSADLLSTPDEQPALVGPTQDEAHSRANDPGDWGRSCFAAREEVRDCISSEAVEVFSKSKTTRREDEEKREVEQQHQEVVKRSTRKRRRSGLLCGPPDAPEDDLHPAAKRTQHERICSREDGTRSGRRSGAPRSEDEPFAEAVRTTDGATEKLETATSSSASLSLESQIDEILDLEARTELKEQHHLLDDCRESRGCSRKELTAKAVGLKLFRKFHSHDGGNKIQNVRLYLCKKASLAWARANRICELLGRHYGEDVDDEEEVDERNRRSCSKGYFEEQEREYKEVKLMADLVREVYTQLLDVERTSWKEGSTSAATRY
ncbi:unnamed protein product [Amoebophrya sp. A120]|nr:unnamed protein product [Amoebophrya sp. A120]|eukprot:GSA120T00022540001.1